MSAVKGGEPVGVALIGSGRMGSFHGQMLARRIPGARLVAVADPAPDAAERVAAALGADRALRFLNPGAEAAQVYATADALVEPDWRDRDLLDTAVVVVRFDNGAVGVAEACFEAAYGYDVRGEVLGSGGMATMGDGRRTGMVFSDAAGRSVEMVHSDQELLAEAYVAELTAFVDAVHARTPAPVGGDDARAALAIALAAAESVRTSRPVWIHEIAK